MTDLARNTATTGASDLKLGDLVLITAGPFARGRARVLAVDSSRGLVQVEMKILGQPAPFTVHLDQIRLVGE